MDLTKQFEKETGLEYYEYLEKIGNLVPIEYAKWLEAKINFTDSCEQLCNLDGKKVLVKFKVSKFKPKIDLEYQ